MAEVTISVRVDEGLHNEMKLHDEINWSAILRKAIEHRLEDLEHIDVARAEKAIADAIAVRKSGAFSSGKPSLEIIREWRTKRK